MKNFYFMTFFLCAALSAQATVKPRPGHPAYAKAQNNSSVVVSGTEEGDDVSRALRRKIGSQQNAPLKAVGSPKVPVILVQFSDKKFTSGLGTTDDGSGNTVQKECLTPEDSLIVNEFFTKFCNGDAESEYYKGHGSFGSIREYFRDQSLGQFTPEFVLIGPVTLSKSYSYYGKNSGDNNDIRISEFYKDAIKEAQKYFTNWAQFDNDGNNTVDMAFFLYAGRGENDSNETDENTIWPQERPIGGTIGTTKYGCYACCNEVYDDEPDGIGVFVHELSHALGLPDFYDNNYVAFGLDYWDIMDSGCYNLDGKVPCNYSAYERDFMGWKDIITLEKGVKTELTLKPISQGGDAYKIVNPQNSNEYYVIENRQTETWDTYIGNGTSRTKMHGLMVAHVDYKSSIWANNYSINGDVNHQHMTIIPASGELITYSNISSQEEYNNYMAAMRAHLFPGSAGVTQLTGAQAYVYTATGDTPHQMNQPLTNIVEKEDGTITLTFCGDDATAIESLFANTEESVPVYNLAGMQIGTTTIQYGKPTQLPDASGIYIVKGKKYIK